MRDRAMQALYALALSPVAETLGDPNSYGFRPKRSAADAIVQNKEQKGSSCLLHNTLVQFLE